jgi:hypothetical protein
MPKAWNNSLSKAKNATGCTLPLTATAAKSSPANWNLFMNKTIRFLASLLLIGGAIPAANAQTANPTPVDFPAGDRAWIVTFENTEKIGDDPKNKVTAAPLARKNINIVCQGGIRRDLVTWGNGSVTEIWWVEGPPLAMFESARHGKVSVIKADEARHARYDESAFSWLKENNYLGVKSYLKKSCDYYQSTQTDLEGKQFTVRAWIDPKTRRPTALYNGSDLVSFDFDSASVEPLTLPQKFEIEMKRYQAFYGVKAKGTAR